MESDILKQFYRLNRSVRLHYLEKLAALTEDELLRDRGASYPSLLDIFVHVIDGYRFWLLHIINKKADPYENLQGKLKSLAEAKRVEAEVAAQVLPFVEGLGEENLDEEIALPWDNQVSRLGDILWHIVEEELQHRGEMNALLWQMDMNPPIGTYDDWLHAKKNR